jgi:hypothetical protein
MSSNLQNNNGLFIPTTNIYEIEQIQQEGLSKELIRNILVHLYQDMSNVAIALNLKDSAYYFGEEFMNGQVLFPNPNIVNANLSGRQIFRTVVNFGALPVTTTKSVPHNIIVNNTTSFTRIYGCASNTMTFNYIPIPYSSSTAVANNIQLSVDSMNVNITTGIDQSAYTTTYVILEYVKE